MKISAKVKPGAKEVKVDKKGVIFLYGGIGAIIIAVFIAGYILRYKQPEDKSANLNLNNNASVSQNEKKQAQTNEIKNKNNMHTITIETNYGEIKFETYDADAPKAVNNFITLSQKGFYNNLTFHRVINGFMIQGGDPNCSSSTSSGPCGTGGPGYSFEDELNPNTKSYQAGYQKGVVAMANAGPNTNASQFFIMLQDTPLPHNYTIFGKVISGQDIVDVIGKVQTGANNKPLKPVIMEKVIIEKN